MIGPYPDLARHAEGGSPASSRDKRPLAEKHEGWVRLVVAPSAWLSLPS